VVLDLISGKAFRRGIRCNVMRRNLLREFCRIVGLSNGGCKYINDDEDEDERNGKLKKRDRVLHSDSCTIFLLLLALSIDEMCHISPPPHIVKEYYNG
jgi:hypothetical protein